MQQIFKPVGKAWRWVRELHPALLGGITAGVVVVAVGTMVFLRTQGTVAISVASQQSVQVTGPLSIDFNQDVADGFKASIVPKVEGDWEYKRTLLGVSAVSFKPAKRFEAGRSYTLEITGAKRAVTRVGLGNFKETFKAQVPPAIKSTTPEAGAKDVPTKPRLVVTLIEPNRGVRDLKPKLDPAVALRLVSTDDRTFTWEPTAPLKQGQTYVFSLEDDRMSTAETKHLLDSSFTVVSEPVIAAARTGGSFSPGQNIDIAFAQPMEQTESFDFGKLAGKGSWMDDRTYRYVPTASTLKPGTTYTYTVKAGLKSKAGGVIEADKPLQFATNGAVGGSGSPSGGNVALNAPIKIAFDQGVDRNSAQSRFSISPQVNGAFSWSSNTMTFTPSGYAYQTNYTYQVAPGVVPTWGLPSTRAIAGSFSTVTQTIKLNVPAYKTQYKMSCELAGTRMLLAYRGINVSDWDVLMKINYNPRPRDKATNTWDDPNVMYVGDVNGNANATSYGVHARPLVSAVKSYGRNATDHYNVSANWLASQIHGGNPIMFWGHSTPAKPDSWNTPGGGVVQTWLSSHARVIYGVVGKPEAPTGFHIIETSTGKTMYWTTAQLMANMNVIPGVSNQALVVY